MANVLDQKITEDETNAIYLWVDQVSLTRPKKNIARDFCDCVLVAEVIKHFHPKLVDIHNYPQAHNLKQKFTNWNTLNKKVLKRLNMILLEEEIDDLVNAKPGNVEKFLFVLKAKLENFQYEPVVINHNIPANKVKTLNYAEISKHQDQSHIHYGKNENINNYNSQQSMPKLAKGFLPQVKTANFQKNENHLPQGGQATNYSGFSLINKKV
jgi:hypothetical protein